jgi:hypothetical protein
MLPNDHRSRRALRYLIRFVRALTLLGAGTLVLVPAIFWLSPDWVRDAGAALATLGNQPIVADERARLIGAAVSTPSVLLGLYGLWQLWRLFGEYGAGRVFAPAAQHHLRRFAVAMLASALLAPLLRAAVGVALTWGNPPGQRMLALTLSWNDYIAILCGAVLLAVAVVMADAVRIAEENEGFV